MSGGSATAGYAARERAFWVTRPGQGEIRERGAAPAPAGHVIVEARYSAISRGTESLVFRGLVPESEYERMRCPFQEGRFPGPVKYGYASVGRRIDDGATVFCLYPHQDRYAVPADALLPVPADVPGRRAALAANMETAVNALWDGAPRVGDRVAVVGAGVVGCLVAALAARIPGATVVLVDPNPARADVAAALGTGFVAPDDAEGDCDLVYHASGVPAGLTTALSLAGFEARVVELSWYGTTPVSVPLGQAFHARRLQLVSSQVGSVAPARRPRHSHRDRLALALALLADPAYDALITGESRFEDLPQTMARLAAGPGDTLCNIIRYE